MINKIGDRVRYLRGRRSRRKFGELYGIHQNTVLRYETEEREPDRLFLMDLAEKEGVSMDWLLTGKNDDNLPVRCPPDVTQKIKITHGETLSRPSEDVTRELITALREIADLRKENGELRLEIERLKNQHEELKRHLNIN